MTFFANGKTFRVALAYAPPFGSQVPVVQVQMATQAKGFRSVIGKMDSGCSRTCLTFGQAHLLGIAHPGTGRKRVGRTAAGRQVLCYVHAVSVRIAGAPGSPGIAFQLDASFSKDIENNLFGCDWLKHLCIAVDRGAVHFLSD